ncbi:hypothetical protein E0Z10_g7085, partial [Xylaria hypoxylon]
SPSARPSAGRGRRRGLGVGYADDLADDDVDSEAVAQRTPSTDSADDFELLEKSVDDLANPKTTGSQAQSGKAKKRSKKRS